ncbi:Mast cell protease 3 [Camelus dromedarius]|uniref:Mast cell protease 3 n=1 Tax=Camelus dromedarius TaxID=9838 RepID=A0A5N4E337_CAMDR|nr:Mast cell protease 3 [Camelus dromedarius]
MKERKKQNQTEIYHPMRNRALDLMLGRLRGPSSVCWVAQGIVSYGRSHAKPPAVFTGSPITSLDQWDLIKKQCEDSEKPCRMEATTSEETLKVKTLEGRTGQPLWRAAPASAPGSPPLSATGTQAAGVSFRENLRGYEAEPHSRPTWHFFSIQTSGNIILWGGFLAREDFVLTAAHCWGSPALSRACDSTSLSLSICAAQSASPWGPTTSEQEGTQQVIRVRRAIPHPDDDDETTANDVMLLQAGRVAAPVLTHFTPGLCIPIPHSCPSFRETRGPLRCTVWPQGIVSFGTKDGTLQCLYQISAFWKMQPLLLVMAVLLPPGGQGDHRGPRGQAPSRPHMAFVQFLDQERMSGCGGVLVQKDFVLTAAHCRKLNQCHPGAHNIKKQEGTQQVVPLKSAITLGAHNISSRRGTRGHPGEKSHPPQMMMMKNTANDVMLLQAGRVAAPLTRKANLTTAVSPIRLPQGKER